MSDFWIGVVNLKNAKHLEKDQWRINACSVASYKKDGGIFAYQKMRKKK